MQAQVGFCEEENEFYLPSIMGRKTLPSNSLGRSVAVAVGVGVLPAGGVGVAVGPLPVGVAVAVGGTGVCVGVLFET